MVQKDVYNFCNKLPVGVSITYPKLRVAASTSLDGNKRKINMEETD